MLEAVTGKFTCTTVADDIVRQAQGFKVGLVRKHLRDQLGTLSVDVVRIQVQSDKSLCVHE